MAISTVRINKIEEEDLSAITATSIGAQPISEKNQIDGYAGLDENGNLQVSSIQIRAGSRATIDALVLESGEIAAVINGTYPELRIGDGVTSGGKVAEPAYPRMPATMAFTASAISGIVVGNVTDGWKAGASLTGLIIGSSTASIGETSFASNSGITGTLFIPKTVTSIGNAAFASLGITGITFEHGSNPAFPGQFQFTSCVSLVWNNIIFSRLMNSIPANMFSGCRFTGVVQIPDHITSIGSTSFASGGTGITRFIVPPTVTSVGGGTISSTPISRVDLYVPFDVGSPICGSASIGTIHTRISDPTWTAGTMNIYGQDFTIVKDLEDAP